MVSFLSHMAIGIFCAEIILRFRTKNSPDDRAEKRVKYWWVGLFAGLAPDLDVIPGIILGLHSYTFHHIITHTFLALGIIAILTLIVFKKNPLSLVFFAGYSSHLLADFIDNSISPLGPFDTVTTWGLIPGWVPLPGGSWASEFWLPPWGPLIYRNFDLWSIFMHNGWGIPVGSEFLSYYDLVGVAFFFIFAVYLIIITIKQYILKKE
ncbi:MAG: metal-dependent hydrolase [Candidatus Helarchaeota archaeon]